MGIDVAVAVEVTVAVERAGQRAGGQRGGGLGRDQHTLVLLPVGRRRRSGAPQVVETPIACSVPSGCTRTSRQIRSS